MTLPHLRRPAARHALAAGATLALGLASCGGDAPTSSGEDNVEFPSTGNCIIEGRPLNFGGVAKDGIPALSNPTLVAAGDPGAAYLSGTDRVIGLLWDGEWVAVPLNIQWWHEIVNLSGDQARLAVSYCPLTGTSVAFDRGAVGGAEFGVSGLLYRNNLVMYDRTRSESVWPQLLARAGCGPSGGTELQRVPVIEMTWDGWQDLHPSTRVLSDATGFARDYRVSANPYRDYERPDAPPIFPDHEDPRRRPKERVLGIPDGSAGGVALPFPVLARTELLALTVRAGATDALVLWDRARQAAMAFHPSPVWAPGVDAGAGDVRFRIESGRIVDDRTGSVWTVEGRAVEGPAAGSTLQPVDGALVAFWFAWAAFHPDTQVLDALP